MLKRINNIYLIIIIFCSTSLFSLSALGSGAKVAELFGALMIAVLLILFIVYGEVGTPVRHNFTPFILLIFFALITSMFMALYSRDQKLVDTLFAQRAIYYYLLYFLLHQLKIKPNDLERIFMAFGLLYVLLYFIQFFLYPKIIFDVFILSGRGTVRIYLKGSDYLALAYFFSIQAFFRTNRIKYLILILLFFSIYVLLGGRQTMATMAITLVLFLIFSKKVKSRLVIGFLILVCAVLLSYMFQGIIQSLVTQSIKDSSHGADYIRILAAKHYLTDFFKTPIAYITGNGMYGNNTSYGQEIRGLMAQGYYLGDIGLLGNFAIYGGLFIIGVLGICIKSLTAKYLENQAYIRFAFVAICLSLITGGGFVNADFICAVSCMMYMIDVSNFYAKTQ